MLEIVMVSGKGGVGKTTLLGAFAHIADNKIVCDLDVDAPDMHLLLSPSVIKSHVFKSAYEAVIDPTRCIPCNVCWSKCKFGAIREINKIFTVQPHYCEGCKVCVAFCPQKAIDFHERMTGCWYLSSFRYGHMLHAQLFPGRSNSGKLITLLRQEARKYAIEHGKKYILCDGPAGTGAQVIDTVQGASLAVIVAEPTCAGVSDFKRVATLCEGCGVRVAVVLNKCDINSELSDYIKAFSAETGYDFVGMLPSTSLALDMMLEGKVLSEAGNQQLNSTLHFLWDSLAALAQGHPIDNSF